MAQVETTPVKAIRVTAPPEVAREIKDSDAGRWVACILSERPGREKAWWHACSVHDTRTHARKSAESMSQAGTLPGDRERGFAVIRADRVDVVRIVE